MALFNEYFTAKYVLSKNCIINLVLSDRSDGKTFDIKVRALEEYERNKRISIYMRRYKTEFVPVVYNTFFDEVLAVDEYSRFNKWKFRGSKRGIEVKINNEEWDFIVYFIPLSMSGKLKSTLDVQRIDIINFDEYVPLDFRFLPNEMEILLEFWKTIDRDRDKTQLIILGNKIVPFLPVLDYFDIPISIEKDKIRFYKNDTIAVQIYSSKEHKEKRTTSRFTTMVKGTSYEEYDNGSILFNLGVKQKTRKGLDYFSSFLTKNGEGSIWSSESGYFVISTYKRKDGFIITDNVYNIDREFYDISYGRFKQLFKSLYKTGNLYFENDKAYHYFEDILKKLY